MSARKRPIAGARHDWYRMALASHCTNDNERVRTQMYASERGGEIVLACLRQVRRVEISEEPTFACWHCRLGVDWPRTTPRATLVPYHRTDIMGFKLF
jgi:hypothetical protein